MSMSVAFNSFSPAQAPARTPRGEEPPTPMEKIREVAKSGEEPKTPFKPDAGKDEDEDEGAPPPRRTGRGLDILV